jgi:hypothetical protein
MYNYLGGFRGEEVSTQLRALLAMQRQSEGTTVLREGNWKFGVLITMGQQEHLRQTLPQGCPGQSLPKNAPCPGRVGLVSLPSLLPEVTVVTRGTWDWGGQPGYGQATNAPCHCSTFPCKSRLPTQLP